MQSQDESSKDSDSFSGPCKISCILIIYNNIELTSLTYKAPDIITLQIIGGKLKTLSKEKGLMKALVLWGFEQPDPVVISLSMAGVLEQNDI